MTEADFWRQRYEMLMANFGDMVKAATAKQPVLLADKESYELGKLHGEISERETCAKVCESIFLWSYDDPGETAANAIRTRGEQA